MTNLSLEDLHLRSTVVVVRQRRDWSWAQPARSSSALVLLLGHSSQLKKSSATVFALLATVDGPRDSVESQ